MFKNKLIVTTIIIFFCTAVKAQYKWSFGGMIGPANYLGEIGGKDKDAQPAFRDMRLKTTRYSVGAYARKKLRPWITVKVGLNYIRLAGADSNSTIPGRLGRNLSFIDNVFELTVHPEFTIYELPDFARIGRKGRVDFRTYAFVGITGFYFNPKAKYFNGTTVEWYNLRDLRTEGQLKPYPKFSAGIPVGIGMDYTFYRKHRIGMEISFTRTFTDYLDDVSTFYPDSGVLTDPIAIALSNRYPELSEEKKLLAASPYQYAPGEKRGGSKSMDYYSMVQLEYSFVLKGKSTFYKSKYNYLTGTRRKFKRKRVRAKF